MRGAGLVASKTMYLYFLNQLHAHSVIKLKVILPIFTIAITVTTHTPVLTFPEMVQWFLYHGEGQKVRDFGIRTFSGWSLKLNLKKKQEGGNVNTISALVNQCNIVEIICFDENKSNSKVLSVG